jgi:hypothetical protein
LSETFARGLKKFSVETLEKEGVHKLPEVHAAGTWIHMVYQKGA